jgi:hypothetical protein
MTPDELRKLIEESNERHSPIPIDDLRAAADAWEAQLKTSPWQIGVELIEAKARIEELTTRLEEAET